MSMNWRHWFRPKRPAFRIVETPRVPAVLLTRSCFDGLVAGLAPANARGHEGVAFLLGQSDGIRSLGLQAVRPRAITTRGSFHVPAVEMARVIQAAGRLDLQVIAQVHTHPGDAYHSDGDEDGANIGFDGFVSIVIPDYGARLPSLQGSAIYHFNRAAGWTLLPLDALRVIEGGVAL
jgi:hypothetical protein